MMDAASERQVGALAASHIKAVGILEDVRIPAGRAERQDDVVAFSQCKPVHLAIREHAPEVRLRGRVETQQLLYRRRVQTRVADRFQRLQPGRAAVRPKRVIHAFGIGPVLTIVPTAEHPIFDDTEPMAAHCDSCSP